MITLERCQPTMYVGPTTMKQEFFIDILVSNFALPYISWKTNSVTSQTYDKLKLRWRILEIENLNIYHWED